MDLLTIILIILAIGIALYFNKENKNVFEDLDIPHHPALPIFGNMAPVLFRKIHTFHLIQKFYNAYSEAKYFGMYEFRTPIIVLRDPELIKSVTIKNSEIFPDHRGFADSTIDPIFGMGLFSIKGSYWKEMRNLFSPFFTSSKMKMMFHLMKECSVKFTDTLIERSRNKNYNVNLKDVFTRITADVIFNCTFGVSVDSMNEPKNELYVVSRKSTNFEGLLSLKFLLLRHFKRVSKFFGVKIITESAARFFTNLISSNMAIRKEKGITRSDFLQLMMDAKDKPNVNRKLNLLEITANSVIFVFGGLDTVSSGLCFTAHEIAVNPEVQEKLHAEIDAVLEECNGEPTYTDINNMSYLDAVINESLRLYPQAGFIDRVCNSKFELPPALPGKKPVTVEPGMSIYIPVLALHRDPNYYENPDEFHPERFLGDTKINANSSTYLPFGMGPRICIGNRFALLEMKVTLFQLLSRCNLKPCSKTPIPIKFKKDSFALLPEGGFWLKVEERK